jgi:hypothetical protein
MTVERGTNKGKSSRYRSTEAALKRAKERRRKGDEVVPLLVAKGRCLTSDKQVVHHLDPEVSEVLGAAQGLNSTKTAATTRRSCAQVSGLSTRQGQSHNSLDNSPRSLHPTVSENPLIAAKLAHGLRQK